MAIPDAATAAQGTAFTYQGNLKQNGQPVTASCSFQFSLWDALTGGAEQGTMQTFTDTQAQAGVFSVQLDFGNQFTGDARWLKTAVKCPGDAAYTTLNPRQPLSAVPYALGLLSGATVNTTVLNVPALSVKAPAANANAVLATGNGNGYGVVFAEDESADGGFGLYGKSARGTGAYGITSYDENLLMENLKPGVYGVSDGKAGVGVRGEAMDADGDGVRGVGGNNGVVGEGYNGVVGIAQSGEGAGVVGHGTNDASAVGVRGVIGVNGGPSSAAVKGMMYGRDANGIGV